MSLAAEDISASFAICFICCRPSCVQPTAVAWCVRVIQRSSRGVCGSFDDRRPSSLQTTIVVPTKIAWCVPSCRGHSCVT